MSPTGAATQQLPVSQQNGHLRGHAGGAVLSTVVPEMCYFCFDVLESNLSGQNRRIVPAFTNDAYPLFVTWKIDRDLRLRGCIGTFSPKPLHASLQEYAIISSLKDERFSPVSMQELPRLTCSVSLLIDFQDCQNCFDWQVGVHGIRIEFVNERNHVRTATYLPEVSSEQGWDQEETVVNLLRKGGYRSQVTHQYLATVKCQRYRSEKLAVTYHDWLSARGFNQNQLTSA